MRCSTHTILVLLLMFLAGCKNSDEKTETGIRIISLSPSITATIVDLGLTEHVVGRSTFCKDVDSAVPVVGDLYDIDYERLLRLQPSHVLVQETGTGVDQHLLTLAQQGAFAIRSWRVENLEDIQKMHRDLMQTFGLESDPLQVELEPNPQLLSPVLIMTQGSGDSAGLCFGTNTYLNDLLELMGSANALQRDGWVSLSFEDMEKLHPAAIVIVADNNLATIPSGITLLNIPVFLFMHKDVLVPSSKIVDVARELQREMSTR